MNLCICDARVCDVILGCFGGGMFWIWMVRNESRCKSGLRLFLRVDKRSDAENSRSFFCLLEVIYASWSDDAHVDS
jgi:hypothetical protein